MRESVKLCHTLAPEKVRGALCPFSWWDDDPSGKLRIAEWLGGWWFHDVSIYICIYTHIYYIYVWFIYVCVYICMYVPSHCNFLHIVQWVKGEFSTSEFSQSYGAICIFNPSAVRQCGWVQTIDFETCSFGYGLATAYRPLLVWPLKTKATGPGNESTAGQPNDDSNVSARQRQGN